MVRFPAPPVNQAVAKIQHPPGCYIPDSRTNREIIRVDSFRAVRVAQVISSMSPRGGGPVEAVIQISRALLPLGYRVTIATLDEAEAPWLKDFDLRVMALGPSFGGYRFGVRIVQGLAALSGEIDAFIVHGLWQFHGLATRYVARRKGLPYFLYAHGMLDPWSKEAYPIRYLKKMAYWKLHEYQLVKDAAGVIFTSEEERLRSRGYFRRYSANELVVPHGIASPPPEKQHDRLLLESRFPELRGKTVLLFLGRIHPQKGCELLLHAFSAARQIDPSLHLFFVGPADRDYQRRLMRLAAQLEISDLVTWAGCLVGPEKWTAFRMADAFVLPSHQESFGMAVVEAMATGTPVLISNKVNIWKDIERDGAGLVDDDTRQGTTRMLKRWATLDCISKNKMRDSAIRCMSNRFNADRCAIELSDVIQHAIAQRQGVEASNPSSEHWQ
jgi:glycosyltransferase involved in cell wall biosynthesis